MKGFAVAAFVAVAAAMPQAKPAEGSAPAGCTSSYNGKFNLGVVQVVSPSKRQAAGVLECTLENGVLKDQAGRQANIVANHQFQFDPMPQPDAISDSGYAVCGNSSLALGSTTVFWQCNSGDINNLYDESIASYCIPVHLQAQPVNGGGPAPGQTSVGTQLSQISDGQPQPTAVTQIGDGQPQAPSAPVITQISDGQPQGPTGMPVITQIGDGQPQAPSAPVITQISDGQPQAPVPTGPVVTQISDGQPQAPTPTPPAYTGAAPYATPIAGALAGAMALVALL